MSGAFSGVPNTFQNAVTATGLQLDQNFNTFTAYLNDPTNRNNFAVDGSSTNTVVVNFSPAVAGGYTAGLELTWKWGITNTGATVANANGLGNISVVNPNGSALVAGQGIAGSIGKAVFDGTRAIFLTPPSPASAAEASAAVTLAPYVSPGRLQNHPGVAKAWASFPGTSTGTFTGTDAYNVASIVRLGTGTYAINFTTPFANVNYACFAMPQGTGVAAGRASSPLPGTLSVAINVFNSTTGAATDQNTVFVSIFGSQ